MEFSLCYIYSSSMANVSFLPLFGSKLLEPVFPTKFFKFQIPNLTSTKRNLTFVHITSLKWPWFCSSTPSLLKNSSILQVLPSTTLPLATISTLLPFPEAFVRFALASLLSVLSHSLLGFLLLPPAP